MDGLPDLGRPCQLFFYDTVIFFNKRAPEGSCRRRSRLVFRRQRAALLSSFQLDLLQGVAGGPEIGFHSKNLLQLSDGFLEVAAAGKRASIIRSGQVALRRQSSDRGQMRNRFIPSPEIYQGHAVINLCREIIRIEFNREFEIICGVLISFRFTSMMDPCYWLQWWKNGFSSIACLNSANASSLRCCGVGHWR